MTKPNEPTDQAQPGEAKPKRPLYEPCPACAAGLKLPHGCKMLAVVKTGVTVEQLDYIANLDALRQEAGISAAMLRDGRASAFRDLLAAIKDANELIAALIRAVEGGRGMNENLSDDINAYTEKSEAAIAKAERGAA